MFPRLLITGGPGVGKSTLAVRLADRGGLLEAGIVVDHADDLAGVLGWSEASLEVSRWFDRQGPWVIEGVAIPRALRKWLIAHPGNAAPCERIYYMTEHFRPPTKGQVSMTKGVMTVWREIVPELERRGVEVRTIGKYELIDSRQP